MRGPPNQSWGNHEFNAIAWLTPDPDSPGEFLRPRRGTKGAKNRAQHAVFLGEFEGDTDRHEETIRWFLSLPLWLDLPGLRVVHACWHEPLRAWLEPHLENGKWLTRDLMVAASAEAEAQARDLDTPSVFRAVDCLLKGLEVALPDGATFKDADGHERHRARVRWWDASATTFRDGTLGSSNPEELPLTPLPPHVRLPPQRGLVCFGHYWMTGAPQLQSPQAACVDYSAGKGGPLVAYRYDREPELLAENLVWVQ